MKTALFITDCSIDTALVLRNWLANYVGQPLHLTVVHPYGIPPGESLHKTTCEPAKLEALARLDNWTALLGDSQTNSLTTETLFGTTALALRIHLHLRDYDYWLVEDGALIAQSELTVILRLPTLRICPIVISEEPMMARV